MSERTNLSWVGSAQPLIVSGLPPCMTQMSTDETWHVQAQLAAEEQSTLVAAVPEPEVLCQRAQHALGLAGVGSRIAPDRNAIGVYLPTSPTPFGATPLILDGQALLWSIARASSESLRALIAAATQVMRTAHNT